GHGGKVAFCREGRAIASMRFQGMIAITEIKTAREQRIGTHGTYQTLAVTRKGDMLAAGRSNGIVEIYDLTADEPKRITSLEGHTDQIVDLAFSPDGEILATADDKKGLKIWAAKTWKKMAEAECE